MSENLVQYVLDAQQGSEDAFAKLFSNTLKNSYYLCLKLTADNEAAQQVLKEAYAVAFNGVDKLKRPEAFEAWLKQKIAGVYKDTQSFVFSDADGDATALSSEFLPAEVLEDDSLCRKIEDAVSYLPKEQRTVTVLHYYVGMPVDFIGKFMSVSVSTVNSLLAKARESIAAALPEIPETLSEDTLPVLTRIFQNAAAAVKVDVAVVRSTFLYAVEHYEKNAAAPAEAEKPAPAAAPASAQVPDFGAGSAADKTNEPATIVIDANAKPSAVVQTGDDLLREIHQSISEYTEEENIGIPDLDAQVGEYIANPVEPDFAAPVDAPAAERAPAGQSVVGKVVNLKKKLSPKTLLYAGIALVLIIVIAVVCGIAVKKSKDKPETDTPAAVDVVPGTPVEWKNGVLTDCSEIIYMNEYCCKFLSANTQKWGLLNNNGDVVLAPEYYDIKNCSYGRQYQADRENYHILVQKTAGDVLYEVNMESFAVSTTPHGQHGANADEVLDDIDTDDYSDRDRYHNGYAAVQDAKTQKWGYIDEAKHKIVIKCSYEAANVFTANEIIEKAAMMDYCRAVENGMVAVRKGGKMGIININEDVIAGFEYDTIMQGSNGVFIAQKNGQWGVILVGQSAIDNYERVSVAASGDAGLDAILQTYEACEGVYEVTRSVNVRSQPATDTDETKLGEIASGTTVEAVAQFTDDNGKDWLCFKYNDTYAWGRMSFFERTEEVG